MDPEIARSMEEWLRYSEEEYPDVALVPASGQTDSLRVIYRESHCRTHVGRIGGVQELLVDPRACKPDVLGAGVISVCVY